MPVAPPGLRLQIRTARCTEYDVKGGSVARPASGESPCRPPRLSRGEIVQAALDLVRREGRDALTMRALAEGLGSGPMSLYSHVRDKEELLEAVGALALEQMDVEVREGGAWTEQLESWMHSLEHGLFEHPELRELIAKQQNDSPALLQTIHAPIRILVAAGFDPPSAVRAAQGMLWVALGFFFIGSLGKRYPREDSPQDQLVAALAKTAEAERAETEWILPHLVVRKEDARDLYLEVVRRFLAGLALELDGTEPVQAQS